MHLPTKKVGSKKHEVSQQPSPPPHQSHTIEVPVITTPPTIQVKGESHTHTNATDPDSISPLSPSEKLEDRIFECEFLIVEQVYLIRHIAKESQPSAGKFTIYEFLKF